MGDRWGIAGPPPEAYSRVTNPERFRPLHGFAERMLGSLETDFDVAREDGYGLDPDIKRNDANYTVRLVPRAADAGPLSMAFTSLPGLWVRLGHWFVEPIPSCGCDACDETAEEAQRRLERLVRALTSAGFSESIMLPLWGDGWRTDEMAGSRGESRISRFEARALIARAGDRRHFDYGPWPRIGSVSGAIT